LVEASCSTIDVKIAMVTPNASEALMVIPPTGNQARLTLWTY
jgi:hypothetical protein